VFKPLNVKNTLKRRIRNGPLIAVSSVIVKVFLAVFGRDPKPPKVTDLKVEETSSFDEGADELWKEASRDIGIIVVRDRAHLNWRYVDIPHRRYRIFTVRRGGKLVGYTVLSLAEKEGFTGGEIVDLFAIKDEAVLCLLLHKALEHFRASGADAIYCWSPEDPTYKKAFRKAGFYYMPPMPLFIVRPFSKDMSNDHVTDYSKWFVMMGDSDFH
jgi:hypothetical protein